MRQFFHTSGKTLILFQGWETISIGDVVGSVMAVVALSVLHECMKGIHGYLNFTQNEAARTGSLDDRRGMLKAHLGQTCFFVVQIAVGNLLMLVAMTYDTYLFLAITIGCGIGYFLVTPLYATWCSQTGDSQSGRIHLRQRYCDTKQALLERESY